MMASIFFMQCSSYLRCSCCRMVDVVVFDGVEMGDLCTWIRLQITDYKLAPHRGRP